jgi:membrane protease YdiL (CAAX protease family)
MGPQPRTPFQSRYLGPPAEGAARLRYAAALLMLFVLMFVGGALLTPWVYLVVTHVATWLGIAADPYPRYLPRVIPFFALLIIPFITRWAGFKSAGELGIVPPGGQWGKFLFGFFAALLALTMICAIILVSGAITLRAGITFKAVLDKFAVALASGVAVMLIEEIIFRGAVLSLLARIFSWPVALVLSSVIFSLVHFMRRPFYDGPLTWYSGVLLLPEMLSGLLDFQAMGATAVSLFLAGMLIGIAFGHTGNLYFSMGLHAGAIVCIKMYLSLTTIVPGVANRFWGTGALTDSWFVAGMLGVAVAMFGLNALRERAANGAPERKAFGHETVWLAYLALVAAGLLGSIVLTQLMRT